MKLPNKNKHALNNSIDAIDTISSIHIRYPHSTTVMGDRWIC